MHFYKLLILLPVALMAGDIWFENTSTIISGTDNTVNFLNTSECVSPCFTDWDGDGLTDLLTGYWNDGGNIRLYVNHGTEDTPVYDSWSDLKADGSLLKVSAG